LGANGNRQQEKCYRGHMLVEANTKPAHNGGRRCRSCECALSSAHNAMVRKGELWTPENVQDYADLKYSELVTNARS